MLENDGRRRRPKAKVVDLDLERLPGDWTNGVDWGWNGRRKKNLLNGDWETLYWKDLVSVYNVEDLEDQN